MENGQQGPACTNNVAPSNAEDLFRMSSRLRTMRRLSDRMVQPICFPSVHFYRRLLISNPSIVDAGEPPTRTQTLKPRMENHTEGRLLGLETPMRSPEQHPCVHFKVPPQTSSHGTERQQHILLL